MARSKTGASAGAVLVIKAAVALLLGLVLPPIVARAQDSPTAAEPSGPTDSFSAAIEVKLLDLQVIVTDDDGHRVAGLPATAFRVLVDGEEAPIELFAEVREPEAGEGDAPARTEAPDSPAAPRAPGANDQPPVNYLVFIDDLMTQESRRNVVLRQLRADLDLLRPGDRMAVVRLARERKLQVLTGWSSDRSVLEAALDRALALPAWGIKYIALRRMASYVANWEGNDTRRSVLAAAGSMRLLDRPDGRHALLLVAGSWDPAEVNRADHFSPWCVTGWCQGAAVYNVLTDTANLLGYAIYAIDVEGRDPDANWGREKRLHAVLGELARVTGGRPMFNGDRLRILAAAVEDTRSYYSIAVTPPVGMEERRSRVEIEILREGLTARSQAAFVPVTREHDRQLDVLNALWLEEGAEEAPIRLTLDHVERRGGGRIEIGGHLAVPVEALEWRSETGREYADVTVEIANVDWRGDSSAVEERRLRFYREATTSTRTGTELVIPCPLDLRRRRHTIVAGLRDRLAGKSYTAVSEIAPREAPPPPAAAPVAIATADAQ